MHKPILTTARTHSRLSPTEQTALKARVDVLAPDYTNLPQRTELEVGIGNGLALFERAKANPSGFYVGSEVYLNGLEVLLKKLEREPLLNLKITHLDAREVLGALPAGRLGRICVLFPDPWPKARHHKRRIVQPEFLAECARVLAPEGELWVVSDWPDYVFHSIATLYTSAHFTLLQTGMVAAACKVNHLADKAAAAGLGPHHLATPPSWWVATKYQAKAAAQGRAPWFVGAVKKDT